MNQARKLILVGLLSTGVAAGFWSSASAQQDASPDAEFQEFLHALGQPALIGANADHPLAATAYRPLPDSPVAKIDQNKLSLGMSLFHENRLSVDQSVGCNTCHFGMMGGTDGLAVSTGVMGRQGNLNAPTTFNAAYNFRQFWDGRAVTLADQALGPIENELEMAHQIPEVLDMLRKDSAYPNAFAGVYSDGITANNLADAIAYFQTVMFTRSSSPFLRQLAGEEGQLSEQATRGLEKFEQIGCTSCHNGINLGGNSYQQLGSALDYYVAPRTAGPHDDGIAGRSQRSTDKHVFKVPTLHGVAQTAPYFHDGSVATLEQAVEEMGRYQLGRELSEQDINDISAFLRSLGGGMGMGMGGMGGMRMGPGSGMARGMAMGQGMNHQHGAGMPGMPGMGRGMPGAGVQTGESDTTVTPAAVSAESHDPMYLAAIAAAEQASGKILAEMERVHSAEIANYDFVQFEHLELIRHARALSFPPATLNASTQRALQEKASELLAATNDLEWLIADFLRAEAMGKVMDTHIQTQETDGVDSSLGDPTQRRAQFQAQSIAMLEMMKNSNVSAIAQSIRDAYPSR